jgi:Tfp pilus assembly protein PilV
LLEVLAAVMIFAMVMTVLISTSTNAVHHVGKSARRLDADRVADSLLSDLEIQIRQGQTPAIENDEFTEEQYSILITMTDLIPIDSAAGAAAPTDLTRSALGGDALAMLGGTLPEVASYLRQYDIEVSWLEQGGPQSVLRTTFAYDWQAAQVQLASLIESASAASTSADDDPDSSDSSDSSDSAGSSGPRRFLNSAAKRALGLDPSNDLPPWDGHNAGERQRQLKEFRNR